MEYFVYHGNRPCVADCLDIIERGMRRLGITPGPVAIGIGAASHLVKAPDPERQCAPITPAQDAEIIRLTRQGKTQAEVAAIVGCSQGAVSKRLLRMGVRSRSFSRRRRQ